MLNATRIHAAVRRSDYSARWYRMYVCAYGLRCDYPRLRLNLLRGCRAFAIAKKSHDYPITASEGPFQDGRTEADYKPKPRAPGWAEVAAPKIPPSSVSPFEANSAEAKQRRRRPESTRHDTTISIPDIWKKSRRKIETIGAEGLDQECPQLTTAFIAALSQQPIEA